MAVKITDVQCDQITDLLNFIGDNDFRMVTGLPLPERREFDRLKEKAFRTWRVISEAPGE